MKGIFTMMKKLIFILLLVIVAKGVMAQIQAPPSYPRPTQAATERIKFIAADKVTQHIGDSMRVADSVYSTRFIAGNTPITFLNLGGNYPNQKLTIVIKGEARKNFSSAPEEVYKGKYIAVEGKITEYKGRPQMEVYDPRQIQFMEKMPAREVK
ncbi:hypothetical protein [Desertivirga arenae]|uniref:hypothetical protein n=1 Tax=Desertivirga arenae TaxID=2810309 RepID=UPI001A9690B2|nr:hypothetical protein [Pedobacter sp. SYSU D00823]